jgi:hypothetical protein
VLEIRAMENEKRDALAWALNAQKIARRPLTADI